MQIGTGTRLGPYEIVSRIGAGGMGEVFKARDTRLDRTVAVKVISREFAERFEREAKAISQLNHPHICTLHDIGHEAGTSYLVMELLEGETLAERIARGPLPMSDVLRLGAQIAEALDRAHRSGVVHRDLKPGNVMHLALAPDERHVAIEIFDAKARTTDVWTRDIATGRVTTRLTFTPKFEWMMTWSPDGSRLFFASNQTDNSDVYAIPRGGGTPALAHAGPVLQAPMDVSRDGRYMLVYDTSNGFGNPDIQAVPTERGPTIAVAATQFDETTARFSPELYYTDREKLIALPIEQTSPEPNVGEPVVLFKLPPGEIFHGFARYPYAPAKNGREFYVLKEISLRIDSPIHVILNASSALGSETKR